MKCLKSPKSFLEQDGWSKGSVGMRLDQGIEKTAVAIAKSGSSHESLAGIAVRGSKQKLLIHSLLLLLLLLLQTGDMLPK